MESLLVGWPTIWLLLCLLINPLFFNHYAVIYYPLPPFPSQWPCFCFLRIGTSPMPRLFKYGCCWQSLAVHWGKKGLLVTAVWIWPSPVGQQQFRRWQYWLIYILGFVWGWIGCVLGVAPEKFSPTFFPILVIDWWHLLAKDGHKMVGHTHTNMWSSHDASPMLHK